MAGLLSGTTVKAIIVNLSLSQSGPQSTQAYMAATESATMDNAFVTRDPMPVEAVGLLHGTLGMTPVYE
jgi:hypothetical protein